MYEEAKRPIRILIVDDDETIADILKDYLSNETRSVDVCYDGLVGIEKLQKKLYDLLITDLIIPEIDGLELLKYAKTTHPDIVVILITGYASLETAIRAIKEGAYDYIRKPFKLAEIKIAVENALDKIKLNRENGVLVSKLQDAYHELMVLKQERGGDGKIASINFFSSNMPGLHYLYHKNTSPNYSDKLQAISSLKEDGVLTESEFKTFKNYLLNRLKSGE
jgi:CheY-like chemotaxis protein